MIFFFFLFKAACGELKNVLNNMNKEDTPNDLSTKSPGPFSHVNLFRHA
jgi:hypothetical protein